MTDEQQIVKAMKAIGTYKKEYTPTIERLAGMRRQYAALVDGYNRLTKDDFVNNKKPVIVTMMENIRKDILAYERDLGLTPAALKKIDAQKELPKSSALADALAVLGNGRD